MTNTEKLEAIYNYVKERGNLKEPIPGSMGGIWGGDTWELPGLGIRVMLVDDGWTKSVYWEGKGAYQTGDRPIAFVYGGDETWLHRVYLVCGLH